MRSTAGSVVVALALALTACSDSGSEPTAPRSVWTPTSPSPPPPGTQLIPTISVISGADWSPVAGASVTVGDQRGLTDAAGRFTPTAAVSAYAPVDVEADGFLTRQTTLTNGSSISLWPVASDAEAAAVRAMIYERPAPFGEVLRPYWPSGYFYVTLAPEIWAARAAWQVEAERFGALLNLKFEITETLQYDANEILVRLDRAGCEAPPGWGFCHTASPYKHFEVQPALASDPLTIRRILASFFLGPSPVAGLMSPDAPAEALTPFELQTVRMILQRRTPNRWPDNGR